MQWSSPAQTSCRYEGLTISKLGIKVDDHSNLVLWFGKPFVVNSDYDVFSGDNRAAISRGEIIYRGRFKVTSLKVEPNHKSPTASKLVFTLRYVGTDFRILEAGHVPVTSSAKTWKRTVVDIMSRRCELEDALLVPVGLLLCRKEAPLITVLVKPLGGLMCHRPDKGFIAPAPPPHPGSRNVQIPTVPTAPASQSPIAPPPPPRAKAVYGPPPAEASGSGTSIPQPQTPASIDRWKWDDDAL